MYRYIIPSLFPLEVSHLLIFEWAADHDAGSAIHDNSISSNLSHVKYYDPSMELELAII